MNTITIELSKEDRQRLDEVVALLGLIAGELKSQPVLATLEEAIEHPIDSPTTHLEPVEDPTPAAEPAPVEPAPVEPVPAEPTPEVKPVSLAEFQKAVTLAVSKSAEAKQAVKTIINKYATSVSGVPEDKRAEVIAELEKI